MGFFGILGDFINSELRDCSEYKKEVRRLSNYELVQILNNGTSDFSKTKELCYIKEAKRRMKASLIGYDAMLNKFCVLKNDEC